MSRFLFITQLYPSGLSGTSVKTRKTIEYLLSNKHHVDVVCIHHTSLVRPGNWQDLRLRIFVIGKSVMSSFSVKYFLKNIPLFFSQNPFRVKKMYSSRLLETVFTLFESETYERIFFDGFSMLQYADQLHYFFSKQEPSEYLHSNFQKKRWIYIDDEDITELMRQRSATTNDILLKMFFWTEYIKSQWYERKVLKFVKEIWAISPLTAKRLRNVTAAKVVVMPTPVADRKFAFRIKSRSIMFTGLLSWLENTAGLEWFLNEVWHLVLQKCPETELYVVGQMAKEKFISKINSFPNVVYKGYVPDLEKLYQKSAVAIAPILINCGIKVKVVTYLSYGLPVVSTQVAAWGLKKLWGVRTAVAATDYADEITSLLTDHQFRLRTAKLAYKNAKKHHGEDALKVFFEKVAL